jgi:hypothetical protein
MCAFLYFIFMSRPMKASHKVIMDGSIGEVAEHKVMPYFEVVLNLFQNK